MHSGGYYPVRPTPQGESAVEAFFLEAYMDNFDRLAYEPETGVFTWAVKGRGISLGSVAGSKTNEGYWQIKLCFKSYRAHRLAWFLSYGVWPLMGLDHINGDKLDNRLEKLREATHSLNMQNKRQAMSNNKSCGLLGASWNKQHERWQAALMVDKKRRHLGYFSSAEDAHSAYLAEKRLMHPGCTI